MTEAETLTEIWSSWKIVAAICGSPRPTIHGRSSPPPSVAHPGPPFTEERCRRPLLTQTRHLRQTSPPAESMASPLTEAHVPLGLLVIYEGMSWIPVPASRKSPPVPAPRMNPPASPPVPSSPPVSPLVPSSPPVSPLVPSGPPWFPLVPSSSPSSPLVPSSSALPKRPQVSSLPERPQEPALPEHPQEPALPERPLTYDFPKKSLGAI